MVLPLVKGKKEAIRVYEPLALQAEADADLLQQVAQYNAARSAYLVRQWDTAQQLFLALATVKNFKKICTVYLQRIARYRNEQLPEDWCGIWQHTDK